MEPSLQKIGGKWKDPNLSPVPFRLDIGWGFNEEEKSMSMRWQHLLVKYISLLVALFLFQLFRKLVSSNDLLKTNKII